MTDTIKTLDDALKAIAAIGPIAREHAQKSEDGRRLAPEVGEAIADAGLWGVFAPRAVGGGGLASMRDAFEIVRSMAYEDTSAGWGLMICGGGQAIVGSRLRDEGRADVFGGGCAPMSLLFAPSGSGIVNADGTTTVTGQWSFASGITYAAWVMANVIAKDQDGNPLPGANGMPEVRSVLFRHDEVNIVDDWHVAGLRGTGSMSFTADGQVVPAERTFAFFGPPAVDEPAYKLPIMTLVSSFLAGMVTGLAERMLDEVVTVLPMRVGPPTFQPASADPINQHAIGRARAAIRAAADATRALHARYDARLAAGEDLSALPLAERAELHHHTVWVADTCLATANELFRLSGASAIYEPNIVQRVWRDINILTQHVYFRSVNHRIAGEIVLGLDVTAPLM